MMLAELIRIIGKKHRITSDICFERVFRNRALGIDCSSDHIESNVSIDDYSSIMHFASEFSHLFFEQDSHYLFWTCRCLTYDGNSILSYLNRHIREVCNIRRGNLNTYKLNGWDVHVLYVYQLANYNFANGITPNAYSWDFDAHEIVCTYERLYHSLSLDSKYLLKVGCFLHDIGVINGVEGHELKGVPLAEQYYKELNISQALLDNNGVTINEDEIIVALQSIIGNHQLVNQVSSEASDEFIYNKTIDVRKSFSHSDRLMDIFLNDFVNIMAILAISDMLAVDDSLLSMEKFCELQEARSFLNNIVSIDSYHRDPTSIGIKRVVSLLRDDLKPGAFERISAILRGMNERSEQIIQFLYDIKHLSYAMAAIKPLASIEKAVVLLDVCERICSIAGLAPSNTVLKFNPTIDSKHLSELLCFDAERIINDQLLLIDIDADASVVYVSC